MNQSLSNNDRVLPNIPVGGIMPGDMRPGTEWGMMWGFSGEVTLWVLFGGRPGLELRHTGQRRRRKTWVRD